MNGIDLLVSMIYSTLALALAFISILGIGLFFQAENSFGKTIVPLVFPLMAFGISLGAILSGRNLTYASFDIQSINLDVEAQGGGWPLRIISFLIVGLCAGKVFSRLFKSGINRDTRGALLFFLFLALFFFNNVVNAIFGTHPGMVHHSFYALIVFWAGYVAKEESLDQAMVFAKFSLLGILIASLIISVIKPELAVQPGYRSWIPGVSIRLWGVGSNPNSIGPLALLLVLLEILRPFPRKWVRSLVISSSLAVFILAQSKTVWVASALAFVVLAWYRVVACDSWKTKYLLYVGCIFSVVAFIFLGSVFDVEKLWQKISLTQAGGDIATLTGRSRIWSVAVNEWLDNIFFGYGPMAWGAEHRQAIGMPFATSAHNQFMQSLSSAGVLGLIAMLAYMMGLWVYSVRSAVATKGVSLAIFVVIVFRCFTEAPLSITTILTGDLFFHFVLFMICLYCSGRPTATSIPVDGVKGCGV